MTEFAKYIAVGVINTIVGYGIFLVFLRWVNTTPEAANAIGYVVALCVAFLLNQRFVFSGAFISANSIARFIAAFAIAFLINQAVLYLLFRVFFVAAEIAQLVAMTSYTLMFYFLNKFFVFRAKT